MALAKQTLWLLAWDEPVRFPLCMKMDLGARVETKALTTEQENFKFSKISIFESLRKRKENQTGDNLCASYI